MLLSTPPGVNRAARRQSWALFLCRLMYFRLNFWDGMVYLQAKTGPAKPARNPGRQGRFRRVFSPRSTRLRSLHPDKSQYAPGTMNSFRDESGLSIIKRQTVLRIAVTYILSDGCRAPGHPKYLTAATVTYTNRHSNRPVRFEWNAPICSIDVFRSAVARWSSKECVGQDLNLRTPTGQDPEPCAFDQAWQPTHVAAPKRFPRTGIIFRSWRPPRLRVIVT